MKTNGAFADTVSAGALFIVRRWRLVPRKPKRPCSYPCCPNLTEGRFCEKHQKEEAKRYERYDRDPVTKRRYGRSWPKIRNRYVALHPFCEECLKENKCSFTEEIHHRLPLREGGTNESQNLIALCRYHHAKLHAERGDRWHNN